MQSVIGHEESPSVILLSHISVKFTAYILHLSYPDLSSFGGIANDILEQKENQFMAFEWKKKKILYYVLQLNNKVQILCLRTRGRRRKQVLDDLREKRRY